MPASHSDTLNLGTAEQAFSSGGNRLCFVHPEDENRCVKVLRPDRIPQIKRGEKSFPKNLKPLYTFDDNHQEAKVYQKIHKLIGADALKMIPQCYGFINTNYGPGLCSQLIRDDNQQISMSLKQYIWLHGKSPEIMHTLAQFARLWQAAGMPSRNLLVHNMVVQCKQGKPQKLWVIDGLGWPDLLPIAYWIPSLARRKAARKVAHLYRAIDQLLHRQKTSAGYGYHGWLEDSQRNQ